MIVPRQFVICLLLVVGFATVAAQDSACQKIVASAFQSLQQHCLGFELNSLCYGHPQVEIGFRAEDRAVEINKPGERAPVAGIARVRSSELDLEVGNWGIALLNLGGNLPGSYQGPGAIVMLAGAAEVVTEFEPTAAISLSTSSEFPDCAEAEAMVALQMSEDLPLNLIVNGVEIQMGSMVTFQQAHRHALSLTVHRGEASTSSGQVIPQGGSVIGILGKTAEGDIEVLDWSGVLPASESELARGQRAQDALNSLARANGWEEYGTFHMPTELFYLVERGDSLFAIARKFQTSVASIIAANPAVETPPLHIGTELLIPNPGSGFAGRNAPVSAPTR